MCLCEDKIKRKTAHFRLPSASQKRGCLSSLLTWCEDFCFAANISLTINSGINATCPEPAPKENLTECNDRRQVCLSGVRQVICTYLNTYVVILKVERSDYFVIVIWNEVTGYHGFNSCGP